MDSNFRLRTSGDTPHRPRGEAASHRSRLPLRRDPPSWRDLDDGTVSQLLEELAGEMNRPSDRTIELGLGAVPQGVTNALGRKQGLGVHSGAIGDGIADLMEAGI